jgi:hypothetical protein
MDRSDIDRHLAIDRYLQGRLTDAEFAEFEERLVWDHDLQDEVDLAERLRTGLNAVAPTGEFTADADPGLVSRLTGTLSSPRYAAAASFLAGIFLASFLAGDRQAGSIEGPTTVLPLMVMRSADVQTIPVDADGMTVLMVDVPLDYPGFRVSIRREDAADPFWTRANLEPGYTEALAVALPGRELAPATYILTVEGVNNGTVGLVQEIQFKTVSPD